MKQLLLASQVLEQRYLPRGRGEGLLKVPRYSLIKKLVF